MRNIIWLVLCFIMLAGCSNDLFEESNDKDQLLVSAATSLTDVMQELATAYEKVDPNTEITFNFGGSGKLAQQIQQGAPADVFLSADQVRMDMLDEQELIAEGTRADFATNELVLIANKEATFTIDSLEDLPSLPLDKIAIGNPDSVAAGTYAKQALQKKGSWGSSIEDKLFFGKDVHQVLTYVESGNADVGFVYRSDVALEKNIEVILSIDNDLHDDIVYPAGVTSFSENLKKSRDFISFLQSDEASSILQRYGFN